jgi:hypothetical protein
MSSHTISISDMQNFVENMDDDIQISSNIGNVIELGGEDLGDDLGAGLLSNTRVSARPAGNFSSSSSSTQNVNSFEPIQDISVNSFEPLEAISLDIPTSGQSNAFPEISVTRESSSSSDLFSNNQTATGPGIHLSAVPRLSPEEERKRKTELINKLNRLETKGYTLTKRFTMDNSLDEIQQEYDRLVDAKNLEASLRFQRQCLMGIVTGAEFLNSKFNPFDWELDGWSESVHENVEDFDEVFEELYDKYKGRGNMPPEAKLMMSLVGSGFMFHMSNSFFRSKMSNMTPDDIFRNNPQLAKQFAAAAAQQAGQGFGNFMGAAMGVPQGPPVSMPPQMPMNGSNPGVFYQASSGMSSSPPMPQMPQSMAAQSSLPVQRREMRGPSGVDDILKTFQEVRAAEVDINPVFIPSHGPSSFQQPAMQAVSEISSINSTPMSEMSTDTTRTGSTVGQRSGRGRRKAAPPVANTMTLNL